MELNDTNVINVSCERVSVEGDFLVCSCGFRVIIMTDFPHASNEAMVEHRRPWLRARANNGIKEDRDMAYTILDAALAGHSCSQDVYDEIRSAREPEPGTPWDTHVFQYADGSRIIAHRDGYRGPGSGSPATWSFSNEPPPDLEPPPNPADDLVDAAREFLRALDDPEALTWVDRLRLVDTIEVVECESEAGISTPAHRMTRTLNTPTPAGCSCGWQSTTPHLPAMARGTWAAHLPNAEREAWTKYLTTTLSLHERSY